MLKKTSSVFLVGAVLAAYLAGCNIPRDPVAEEWSDPPSASEAQPDGEEEGADPHVEEEEEQSLPQYDWEVDLPENHGMDGELLREMHEALADTEMYAILTVKDGYIVDEFYQEEYDASSVFRLNSCSKSITSALIGIAIDQGLISGVDVSIAEYFPQVAGTDKEAITIRHLLEHTSGIAWYEWNSGSTFGEWRQTDSWVDFVLEQPMDTEPGAVFNYSTGGPHLLAAILQEATGMSAYEYALEHLFEPMEMDSVEWIADPEGVTDGGNGVSMTARDAAKFGQLFLDGGNWDGHQLVPQDWVELSTRQQSSGIGSSGVYGYQWWIRTFGDREYDTYYAMGHAGQYILVVPELDLVTVITSSMSQGTYDPRPYFSDYILAACG